MTEHISGMVSADVISGWTRAFDQTSYSGELSVGTVFDTGAVEALQEADRPALVVPDSVWRSLAAPALLDLGKQPLGPAGATKRRRLKLVGGAVTQPPALVVSTAHDSDNSCSELYIALDLGAAEPASGRTLILCRGTPNPNIVPEGWNDERILHTAHTKTSGNRLEMVQARMLERLLVVAGVTRFISQLSPNVAAERPA